MYVGGNRRAYRYNNILNSALIQLKMYCAKKISLIHENPLKIHSITMYVIIADCFVIIAYCMPENF